MTILALEFSSSRRTVAVLRPGFDPVEQRWTESGTPIFSLISGALDEARVERAAIDCLAVGIGPGSYTGIRNAISTVQGWHVARRTEIRVLSSFRLMAWAERKNARTLLVADAQRGECACAWAEEGRLLEPLSLMTHERVRFFASSGLRVCGPGVQALLGVGEDTYPSAAILAELVGTEGIVTVVENLAPIYLREAAFAKAPTPRVVA
ncbi:MAG TPA: tRNA (adenosine(37)-N6)-threonylcarbamoyltransferase complex dimerization subunit type 1 TsaB [Candidatus Limnocylindria bacterium]|jgi:tRNA threonylcarbamoyl adenosine modification protein YeaZ|nr:tRNA (adenosine(37)-N6)-threonylcarbamoyltransferase complex dimerization subunit type 1 TsaB [Candidatus Limnocylindria bacterium]